MIFLRFLGSSFNGTLHDLLLTIDFNETFFLVIHCNILTFFNAVASCFNATLYELLLASDFNLTFFF